MAFTLLATKLYVPSVRPESVPRPRLIQRLNEGLGRKLTLVSAAAGFGKTTLLSTWTAHTRRHVCWLSLDESDNDPVRFWTYVIAALQTQNARLGEGTLTLLQLPKLPHTEELLTTLLDELVATPEDLVLILDDYHVINSQSIHATLADLVDHLPSTRIQFVIATRTDPPLPLARLRAKGQLNEIRADDLRFTPDEATTFLNQVMGLRLSAQDIAAVETRTEGWIAGLQIAALSMQGRGDVSSFIQAFTGSHRYIVDYLAKEVLQRQSADVRAFLLQTCILDRLTAPLCDAVTGQHHGQAMLEVLERANLFIVLLDDERKWYRYHPLFADVLRHSLGETQPDRIPDLHRRAAQWYETCGFMEEAVRHALEARDFDLATRWIEQVGETLWARSQISTMLNWLKAMPDDLIHSSPRLCVLYAWAHALSGQLDIVEPLLQSAESLLSTASLDSELAQSMSDSSKSRLSYASDVEWGLSPEGNRVQIAILRAYVARFRGELTQAHTFCRQALEHTPPERRIACDTATLVMGHVYFLDGETEHANQTLIETWTMSRAGRHMANHLSAAHYLAQLRVLQGQLRQAMAIYQQAQASVVAWIEPSFSGIELIGLGDLAREGNDLEIASRYINEGLQKAEAGGDFTFVRDGYIASARLEQARGNWERALACVQKAEQIVRKGQNVYDTALTAAWCARLWLAQGNVDAAVRWAQGSGLTLHDELRFWHEFEYLTLARVWIAQGRARANEHALSDAQELLERLYKSAQAAGRMGRVIEVLALQALAAQEKGDLKRAASLLAQALSTAEPEGYVRLFIDEGPPMAALLYQVKAVERGGRRREYIAKLLAAFGEQIDASSPTGSTHPLIEPLSEREIQVLHLIAAGFATLEVAERLVITVGTVRNHLKSIFGKLHAHSRLQAVERARELKVL